jgi:branched-chain amino acid transport system substrate-binding protein
MHAQRAGLASRFLQSGIGPIRKLVSQGYDTWFFIAADYAFGKNMVSESQRVLATAGGKVAWRGVSPDRQCGLQLFHPAGEASGAKVIAFANAGEQLVSLMKAVERVRHECGQPEAGGRTDVLTDVHAMGPKIAKGLTTLTAWYWR